ncbi:MAG TPA: hypothetical protein VI489_00675 [Candidatus Brocadiaceae bacterium]
MKMPFVTFLLFIYSCSNNSKRTIIIDNEQRAEGDISKDTIYNGPIRFYDIKTGKVLSEYTYSNGILNGSAIQYYDNGRIAATFFFENNRLNGIGTYFERDGRIKSKSFFYYDLKAGSSEQYEAGIIKNYYFYSLDNKVLFYLPYDRNNRQKITDLVKDYFFYHKYNFSSLETTGLNKQEVEYFLYKPNPPNYDFEYSLVLIDKNYNVLAVIKTFNDDQPWTKFTVPKNIDSSNRFALKLFLTDSISSGGITMFKSLEK